MRTGNEKSGTEPRATSYLMSFWLVTDSIESDVRDSQTSTEEGENCQLPYLLPNFIEK